MEQDDSVRIYSNAMKRIPHSSSANNGDSHSIVDLNQLKRGMAIFSTRLFWYENDLLIKLRLNI